MYKPGDKFEIEIADVFKQGNACLYRIKGVNTLYFDTSTLRCLKQIENKPTEEELHIGEEVKSTISGSTGIVVDCHVPNLDGEDKYAVCFVNKIIECSQQILAKTGKHYNTFTEYLREVRNG